MASQKTVTETIHAILVRKDIPVELRLLIIDQYFPWSPYGDISYLKKTNLYECLYWSSGYGPYGQLRSYLMVAKEKEDYADICVRFTTDGSLRMEEAAKLSNLEIFPNKLHIFSFGEMQQMGTTNFSKWLMSSFLNWYVDTFVKDEEEESSSVN